MGYKWIIIVLAGATGAACLLIPSRTYRLALKNLAEDGSTDHYKAWLGSPLLRFFFTVTKLVMNACNTPAFSKEDLMILNRLLEKLGQMAADPIEFERFERVSLQQDGVRVVSTLEPPSTPPYALRIVDFGVRWRGNVLKPALVETCSGDFVMLDRARACSDLAARLWDSCAGSFGGARLLATGEIAGFLDLYMLRPEANSLFEALCSCHPDGDLTTDRIEVGHAYDGERMGIWGDTYPGPACRVARIIHHGLKRKSDTAWHIKAFVEIENTVSDEH
jgi:hypothetical protein